MTKPLLTHPRMLIAVGNSSIAESLKDAAIAGGVRNAITTVDNREAVNLMVEHPFNLFLVEENFPELGGLDFCRFIRLTSGPMSVAPIIYGIYEPKRDTVLAARNAGINKIVVMPLSGKSLMDSIKEVVLRPRPFIQVSSYAGPCRRTQPPKPRNPERRQQQEGLHDIDTLRQALDFRIGKSVED